jgi:hypothetical protein
MAQFAGDPSLPSVVQDDIIILNFDTLIQHETGLGYAAVGSSKPH